MEPPIVLGKHLPAIETLIAKGEVMREYAFSEEEAREFVHTWGKGELKTTAQETEDYRRFLNLK